MCDLLETLKTEVERFGEASNGATGERLRWMLNITREHHPRYRRVVVGSGSRRGRPPASRDWRMEWLRHSLACGGCKLDVGPRSAKHADACSAGDRPAAIAGAVPPLGLAPWTSPARPRCASPSCALFAEDRLLGWCAPRRLLKKPVPPEKKRR